VSTPNCVDEVFATLALCRRRNSGHDEAWPGGRFAVSGVVVKGDVAAEIRRNIELWVGCVAGALQDSEYVSKLAAAGFEDFSIEQHGSTRWRTPGNSALLMG